MKVVQRMRLKHARRPATPFVQREAMLRVPDSEAQQVSANREEIKI
jgi:hypothetical protein